MDRTQRRKQEVRERILQAAFDLFLSQGVDATKIEDICERADVANRTFFNHFATRQDMLAALAEQRLLNLQEVLRDRSGEPVPARLIGLFDDIAGTLTRSGDTYRELIGALFATTGLRLPRGYGLHQTFVELIEDGVARGEVTRKHDPRTLADIIVGALVGGVISWTTEESYSLDAGLHDLAVALVDLLQAD
ncbi:TetR/AcrR family transcriptional regulator [Mycobacterium sp. 134]|uniref:TetR/AcrR family transcriptional regulator n=1 Tax=Mycobacterium sp. 134 TaxID=3400425 RepID=UPI003AAAD666